MDLNKIFSWFIVVVWMIIIFLFSSQSSIESGSLSSGLTDWIFQIISKIIPRLKIETLHSIIRIFAHFAMYFILGFLLINALNFHEHKQIHKYLIALMISFVYAITDEIHQIYVPGRAGQIQDVIVDFFGGLMGIIAFIISSNVIGKIKRK